MPRQTEPGSTGLAADMLPVEEALARILALVAVMPAERRSIREAAGQVLAEDVVAPFDIPPLDNTAMDGYAVQAADTVSAGEGSAVTLRVVGELAAGYLYEGAVGAGEAVRIMTGAPMPDGADSIVPFEETDESGLRPPGQSKKGQSKGETQGRQRAVRVLKAALPGANIRRRGEDVRQGATILTRGLVLRGAEIAVLASMGIDAVSVVRRPRVAILSTGDELLVPGQPLTAGKIYDSNSYGLAALVEEYGGVPVPFGIARDTVEALTAKIKEATAPIAEGAIAEGGADLVVTSAGVSRGDFDVVKEVLAREGEVRFWTVRMKPGKPLAFGRFTGADGRVVPHIGLPGNPVSSLLAFELFGRPALLKMQGRVVQSRPVLTAVADEAIVNTDGRRVYARVIVEEGEDGRWHARLTGAQGSGVLTSMAYANGYAVCPAERDQVSVGEDVEVLMVDWEQPED